jgi:hypothetical protein
MNYSLPTLVASIAVALMPMAAAAADICPDTIATTGEYRNYSFGFTVTIPHGLKANWNSPSCSIGRGTDMCICMKDHGRGISLQGGGNISVFATYNTIDDTLPTAVFDDLEMFKGRNSGSEFAVAELGRYRLKGMRAWRYIARSNQGGEITVREAVVAQTLSSSVEVFIYIEAPESQYESYRPAYLSLLRSWRVSPLAK